MTSEAPEHTYKYVFRDSEVAVKDILDQQAKFQELDELSRRIGAIEKRVDEHR